MDPLSAGAGPQSLGKLPNSPPQEGSWSVSGNEAGARRTGQTAAG